MGTPYLPTLEGNGFWHTQDWTGAVLPASRLATHSVPSHQSQIRSFLTSAWMASQALLQREQQ